MSPRTRISLDGSWQFYPAEPANAEHAASIRVPSPWQADERFRDHVGQAWYRREFEVPARWLAEDRVVILGFGAVDYFAEVWVNGSKVGEHEGGYLPFELDITAAVRPGLNRLIVRVDDPLEIFPEVPHGKQSWYGLLSGIWQPVWVESRAVTHIQRVKISTFGEDLEVSAFLSEEKAGVLEVEIRAPDGEVVAATQSRLSGTMLRVERPQTWSPDQPHLYTLTARLVQPRAGATETLDEIVETFGFRTIEKHNGRILLNGRPFYLRGALDQDYYPELICTPPSQEYIEDQFRKAKEMGINCLRVHIKVADPRYYAAADKVGLLIWTELPNHSLLTENARRRARATLAGMLERDWNHPCIGIWTIINESWGINLTDPSQRAWLSETYRWLKELDPTRLVVGNSACWSNFHVVTDIADFHIYYDMPDHHDKWRKWTATYARRPWWLFAHEYTEHKLWKEFLLDPWFLSARPPAPDILQSGDEPLVVSEFGNWGLPNLEDLYEGNAGSPPWWFDTGLDWNEGVVYPRSIEQRFREYYLNRVFPSLADLTKASQRLQLDALKFEIENMRSHASLQGYVITELTDVHWESNGLLDMYRNPKLLCPHIRQFNADDVLIPLWEQLAYGTQETCSIKLLFSHYSPDEIRETSLEWQVACGDFVVRGILEPQAVIRPFDVTELGFVTFELPEVGQPSSARLELRLFSGASLIAYNELDIYVFPRPAAQGTGRPVFSPEFAAALGKLGYTLVEHASQAEAAVVTVLDDTLRDYILRGGRVLLLAEEDDSLQMHVPGLDIEEREDSPWQGDWANSFGWHRFGGLPTGGTVNFAFAGLTPEHVIGDFMSRDFAFDVYAGMFVGWLHKPVPTIARRRMGQGEVLVSTFRLSRNLESNPLAMYLFGELMRLITAPETHFPSSLTAR